MEPRRAVTLLVALLSPAALATAVHCGGGGRAFPDDASADGTAGGLAGDAASTDSACVFGFCDEPRPWGPFEPCPPAAPEAGTSCTTEGELCEYGSDFFIACDAVLACGDGVWHALGGSGSCYAFPDGGEAGCPATWSEASALVGPGGCPARDCQYTEGYCACGTYCGGVGQIRPQTSGYWQCKAAEAGCPSPRPIVGSPCDTDAGCDYGWPCGCGEGQRCVQGVWQGEATPVCP